MADNNKDPDDKGKVVSMTDRAGRENQKAQGKTDTMTGEVTMVMDLSHISAVAFGVRNGKQEKLFWISTKMQGEDRDYRRPLAGEQVKVWFNSAAKNLQTPEGLAQGVVEIKNVSNDSESKAFAWFEAKRKGEPLPPAN